MSYFLEAPDMAVLIYRQIARLDPRGPDGLSELDAARFGALRDLITDICATCDSHPGFSATAFIEIAMTGDVL